ncbi:hypothetical protein KDA11_06790 [Candidatus Saccharibacteria bacterium]|nr:hypothetical protein [Candidatus Saccharibacteria bacterium]
MYEFTSDAKQYLVNNFRYANDNNRECTVSVAFEANQYAITYDFSATNETLSVYRYCYDNSQVPIFIKTYSQAPSVFTIWTDTDALFIAELIKLITFNRLNAVLR